MDRKRLSDREQAGLLGPVKICIEETIFPADSSNSVAERKASNTSEYDRDGRILSQGSVSDGSEWGNTWTYDADGRLLRFTLGNSDGSSNQRIYSYDEKGRLLSISGGGGDRTDAFHYDDQGRKTRIRSLPSGRDGQCALAVSAFFDGTEEGHGLNGGGSVTTLYNEDDQPLESQVYDAEGLLLNRITHNYDANGRLVEEKLTVENYEIPFSKQIRDQIPEEQRVVALAQLRQQTDALSSMMGRSCERFYVYDGENRIKEKHMQMGSFREDMTWTDHGDGVGIRRLMSGFPDGYPGPKEQLWEFQARTIQYDSYGNWTEQTQDFRSSPDEPFKLSGTTHRKLTYW